MKKQPLLLPFLLALSGALLSTIFFPHIRLLVFAPFLALAILRRSLVPCLWIALGSGTLMDLMCSDGRFGLYALNFCTTALIAYRLRSRFFERSPFSFSLFSALIAALSTPLQLLFLFAFGSTIPFDPRLSAADLLLMPFVDALYAFFWFTCPPFPL